MNKQTETLQNTCKQIKIHIHYAITHVLNTADSKKYNSTDLLQKFHTQMEIGIVELEKLVSVVSADKYRTTAALKLKEAYIELCYETSNFDANLVNYLGLDFGDRKTKVLSLNEPFTKIANLLTDIDFLPEGKSKLLPTPEIELYNSEFDALINALDGLAGSDEEEIGNRLKIDLTAAQIQQLRSSSIIAKSAVELPNWSIKTIKHLRGILAIIQELAPIVEPIIGHAVKWWNKVIKTLVIETTYKNDE